MRGARVVAVWVVVALALAGPLQSLALAQPPGPMQPEMQTPPAPAETPAPPAPQEQPATQLPPETPAPPETQAQPTMPPPEPQPQPVTQEPPAPQPQPEAQTPPPQPQVQTPPPPPTPAEARKRIAPRPPRRVSRGVDVYDAGAVVITVVSLPLKAGICALSVPLGFTLLLVTFGSADRASVAIIREGCGQRWIVRGDDIRPEASQARSLD